MAKREGAMETYEQKGHMGENEDIQDTREEGEEDESYSWREGRV